MMTISNDQIPPYIPTLDVARLDQMAQIATAQAQIPRKTAWSIWYFLNFNTAPGLSFAAAALVVLLSATVVMTDLPQAESNPSADIYAEMSDMLMLDIMDDMT